MKFIPIMRRCRGESRTRELLALQCARTAELRRELALWKLGHDELCETADALCVTVALKYGERLDGGGAELTLPRIDKNSLLNAYELDCLRLPGGGYLVRATERTDGEESAEDE